MLEGIADEGQLQYKEVNLGIRRTLKERKVEKELTARIDAFRDELSQPGPKAIFHIDSYKQLIRCVQDIILDGSLPMELVETKVAWMEEDLYFCPIKHAGVKLFYARA